MCNFYQAKIVVVILKKIWYDKYEQDFKILIFSDIQELFPYSNRETLCFTFQRQAGRRSGLPKKVTNFIQKGRNGMEDTMFSKELFALDERGLTLSDFMFFLAVAKNKEAYQSMLSIIMEDTTLRLKEVRVEEVVLNRVGKRAIRLDAWALDDENRQYNTEMENDTEHDDVRKRARFYQGMLDTPILKAGKRTRYKHLPSTAIIFITQEDIFKKDRAKYTFSEQCEEIPGLGLNDGTKKIFLNMSSKNGPAELVSLLQYMKDTRLENPNVTVKDERILKLDSIVNEVRQSEEWEAVQMSILSVGIERGTEIGKKLGEEVGRKLGEEAGKEIGEVNATREAIFGVLEEYGTVPESVRNKLNQETRLEVLKGWFKKALKVKSEQELEVYLNEEELPSGGMKV